MDIRVCRSTTYMRYNKEKPGWVYEEGLPECRSCGKRCAAVIQIGGDEDQFEFCRECLLGLAQQL